MYFVCSMQSKIYKLFFLLFASVCLLCAQDSIPFVSFQEENVDLTALSAITQDKDGRIWIGTSGSGLYVYDGFSFNHFLSGNHSTIAPPTNYISGLAVLQDGNIVIAHKNGVSSFRPTEWKLKTIQLKNSTDPAFNGILPLTTLKLRDDWWIGTTKSLVRYTEETNDIRRYPLRDMKGVNENASYFIYDILKDPHDEVLWLGTTYGLKAFDLRTNTYIPIENLPKWHPLSPRFPYFIIWKLLKDRHDNIWMAAMQSGGILRYDTKKKTWKEYLYQKNKKQPYKGNGVSNIIFVNDSTIYYTSDLGLGKIDFEVGKLKMLHAYDIVKIGWVRATLVDRSGYLWLAGDNGLLRSEYPFMSKPMRTYSPILLGLIDENDRLVPQMESDITFKATMTYKGIKIGVANANTKYKYRWRINNSTWSSPSISGNLSLNLLRYGNNLIRYSASKDGATWKEGNPLEVIIERPFYLKKVFLLKLLMVLLPFALLTLMVIQRFRTRRIKEQRQHEEQLSELQMQSLRYQMNPHFIFNSLSSINNFILKEDTEKASDYLTKFAKLMRSVLQSSRNKLVPLSEELGTWKLYLELEKLRFHNRFDFTIGCHLNGESNQFYIPPALIQPFIENAIWHGIMPKEGAGRIEILMEVSGDHLILTIEDNGIGREMAKRIKRPNSSTKKSLSLKITKARIESINRLYNANASIQIIDLYHDGQANGTRVIVRIAKLYERDLQKNQMTE